MATSSPSPPSVPLSASVSTVGSESSADFDTPRQSAVLLMKMGRRSRNNTAEEKRRMRKNRIKRTNKLAKLEDKVF